MLPNTQDASVSKGRLWAGWILSVLALVPMLSGGIMVLLKNPQVVQTFAKYGFPDSVMVPIGIIELVIVVLYVLPQTARFGGLIMLAHLGGATATHVRFGEPFFLPIVVGVIAWVGLALRDRRTGDWIKG